MSYDVVVAGAGCAGTLIAGRLAALGFRVLLLDARRQEELARGARDLVEEEALRGADVDPARVEAPAGIRVIEVISPDTATRISLPRTPFRLVDRRALAGLLLKRAADSGVHLLAGCPATGVQIEKGRVTGVVTDRTTFRCSLAVCASGPERALCRDVPSGMGIPRMLKTGEHITVYSETRNLVESAPEVESDAAYGYHIGLFGGYAWTYSAGGTVDVGAGVQDRPGAPDPRQIVLGYIRSHPEIGEKVISRHGGRIPTRRPINTMAANGLLAVGDSACQAMPIVARGVSGALSGASIAATVAAGALDSGDTGVGALWAYNREYMSVRGAHQAALDCLRLLIQEITESELSRAMARGYFDEREIMSALSGRFAVPPALVKVRNLLHGLADMSLLFRYESALKRAQKALEHYESYPGSYDRGEFREWSEEADFLFSHG